MISGSFPALRDLDARIRHEVTAIDLDRRAVLVRDLGGTGEVWEGFDQLMIATGAQPVRPPLPGIDAEMIFGVQTLDDGLAVRAALEQHRPRRAVVVGAGYIGLELAEAFCAWGIDVTVVHRGPAPMAALDPDMGVMLTEAMAGLGMTVRLGETVTGFRTHAGRVTAVVTDRGTVPADLVILGLGVRANTAIAATSAPCPTSSQPNATTGRALAPRGVLVGSPLMLWARECAATVLRPSTILFWQSTIRERSRRGSTSDLGLLAYPETVRIARLVTDPAFNTRMLQPGLRPRDERNPSRTGGATPSSTPLAQAWTIWGR